jgi:anti-sigma regulatory factor (Ser/Thr protein kinase)
VRTGPTAGRTGYFHEAAYYRDTAELASIAVPFLVGGVAAGEPTVVALGEAHAGLVHDEIDRVAPGFADRVIYLTGGEMYARPTSAIRAYRTLLAEHVAAGADQIRIIGELAPANFGATWDWWDRYEAAINYAYDDFPLWSMCAYGLDTTPAAVLADVARTHPWTAGPDGTHTPGARFIDPATYLTERRVIPDDPLQERPPLAELRDPEPAAARQAVLLHAPAFLTEPQRDGLVTAVSETATNAIRHGRPPIDVRVWVGEDRMIVTVTDAGAGPKYPYAGLLPDPDGDPGGIGLWLTFQLCDHVSLGRERGRDGFTIRLTVGTPGALD